MKLYHASPVEIATINTDGRFGTFMFFSGERDKHGGAYVYTLDAADLEIIEATRIFFHEEASKLDALVTEFCERFDVSDRDIAEDIISERAQLIDDGRAFDGDDSWDVQCFTARAAAMLGFDGVRVADEHGHSYMINMLGRAHMLQLKTGEG